MSNAIVSPEARGKYPRLRYVKPSVCKNRTTSTCAHRLNHRKTFGHVTELNNTKHCPLSANHRNLVELYLTGSLYCYFKTLVCQLVTLQVISVLSIKPFFRGLNQCILAILKSIKSCIPLFVLGLMRLASVKATDYQEHVSEYGTHWNFFFTLLVVKVSIYFHSTC